MQILPVNSVSILHLRAEMEELGLMFLNESFVISTILRYNGFTQSHT